MSRTSLPQVGLTALAALALFAARPAAAQTSVHFDNLIPPGTAGIYEGEGISSTGKTYTVANYNPTTSQFNTYIVANGVSTPFALPNVSGLPFDAFSYLAGINDSGTAAGWITDLEGDSLGNFVYTAGQFIAPVPTGGSNARYTGVSNDGKVVVTYVDATGLGHGSLYDTTTGTFADLPNVVTGKNTIATAIASNGVVLGYYRDLNNVRHGYTYYNGSFTLLPDVPGIPNGPGASNYELAGINANGLIYGYYYNSPDLDGFGSFLYDGSGYTFLNYPGAANTDIGWGISDTNQFVGTYYAAGSTLPTGAYLATVTPEPGSVALLLGLTVTGAGFLRRRARKRCA